MYMCIYVCLPSFDAPVKNISRSDDQKLFSSYSHIISSRKLYIQ